MPISTRPHAGATYLSREAFVRDHLIVCQAKAPALKYDGNKPARAAHGLEYTRRKCAKNLWRRGFRSICPGGDAYLDDADAVIKAAIARGEARSTGETP